MDCAAFNIDICICIILNLRWKWAFKVLFGRWKIGWQILMVTTLSNNLHNTTVCMCVGVVLSNMLSKSCFSPMSVVIPLSLLIEYIIIYRFKYK